MCWRPALASLFTLPAARDVLHTRHLRDREHGRNYYVREHDRDGMFQVESAESAPGESQMMTSRMFYCDGCEQMTYHRLAPVGAVDWVCDVCGHRQDTFRERVRRVRRNLALKKARAAKLLSQKRDREYALFELGKL